MLLADEVVPLDWVPAAADCNWPSNWSSIWPALEGGGPYDMPVLSDCAWISVVWV